MNLRLVSLTTVVALMSTSAQFGCNSVPNDPDGLAEYEISATLIQDPNIDSSRMVVKFRKDSRDYGGATLNFGSDVLSFSNLVYGLDSIYYFRQDMTPGYSAGLRNLVIDDSSFFTDTVVATVCGNFSITVVNDPNNRILTAGNTVTYTWSGSVNTQNYVIATVLADSAYRNYGYSEYLSNVSTSASLPIEAFSVSPSPDMDTGLYNLYVYAINGVPDSALTSKLLPVPLPIQFGSNINTPDLVGKVGTIQVTLIDTVRAQTSK